ncbi:MAG: AMP-binding protein [Clostridiales bacterium]|nr:AMP-binding protein [Clostridiales bacterium]
MLAQRYARIDFTSQRNFEQQYRLHIPENFNFAYDIVDEYATASPDKKGLIWCNTLGEEKTFTFYELSRLSNQAANFFSSIGLKKGDPVMLILKRRYEYWICVLGLLKIGCIIVPATFQLSASDISYRIEAAKIKGIICVDDPNILSNIDIAAKEQSSLQIKITLGQESEGWLSFHQQMDANSADFTKPIDLPSSNDRMLIYFTSRTTGFPKMAVHSYSYPLAHLATAAYWHNLNDDSLHMAVADTGWAKAGWGKMFGQWICGACLLVYDMERFHANELLEILEKYQATSFCAPPTVYRFLIKENIKSYDLTALEWANTAGEPLNPEVYEQFLEATGVKIHEGFGQSETTPIIMTTKWMEPRPGSTGRPSPLYDVDLVDEQGNSVEDGEEGEIVLRLSDSYPPGLFLGYEGNDAENQAAFAGKMYHTGDIAWRDVDGYYFYIGRKDDVIKSSGYRIGPFEVESALMEHPSVLECAITAVPDPDRGQIVKATIVLAKGYVPSDALIKELQTHVKRATAPYKYPRIVSFVEELPKTASGKIQRGKIRNSHN